jgi:hypothetical protein
MIIRPVLTYGALVWWTKTTLQGCKVALDELKRAACIAVTRAFRRAPTAAAEMMLRLEHLDIFIYYIFIRDVSTQLLWPK